MSVTAAQAVRVIGLGATGAAGVGLSIAMSSKPPVDVSAGTAARSSAILAGAGLGIGAFMIHAPISRATYGRATPFLAVAMLGIGVGAMAAAPAAVESAVRGAQA